jgi:phosphoribosyl 1,2-cyclic phosphodiesterase
MNDELVVRFWGVRGSYPTPGRETLRYGGNTACVEVRAGGCRLILDAGTGIIGLGRQMARERRSGGGQPTTVILLSHLHHDHIQGFPFFLPAFMPGEQLHIYGPGAYAGALQEVLEGNQSPVHFPVSLREMAARKEIRSLQEHELVSWDADGIRVSEAASGLSGESITVRVHHSHSHPGGSYAYRLAWRDRSVVYATDVEGYVGLDRRLAHFARGADLLIHDAQYSDEHYRGELEGLPATQGYGHSTVAMACEMARAAGARQLVLFHHEPAYEDAMIERMETQARACFGPTSAAYEGMEVRIKAGPSKGTVAVSRVQSPANRALPPRRLSAD